MTTSVIDVGTVRAGEVLEPVCFPLTAYRFVMAAGANRDFNSIHHNTEYARATGAGEMYASTGFLLGMWERAVRGWAGDAARIETIKGFRMRRFNLVGDTVSVCGEVADVARDDLQTRVSLLVRCENSTGVTVGPGIVCVAFPAAFR
jgi:acyl dehydratase